MHQKSMCWSAKWHAGECRPVATRAELREVIVEMSKAAQVGKISQGEAQQVTSEV